MKNVRLWWIVALIVFALSGMASGGSVPAAGDRLAVMRLEGPDRTDVQAYLGLSGSGPFDPATISGRLLIIEIFSMYCPHCQREAPAVNRLYQAIEASDTLRGRVKMIGIGVGNSTFEVDHFRKHYQIEFPLFPDEDFVVHKAMGEVRTPFFLIVALEPDDGGRILWSGIGKMDPLDTFLDRLSGFLK
ncbi:alkyl hydroperoxide reductase [Desulfosarcina alkanivorans]|uniref:Alkyl hydroperoxide reductase n=1 Tax=Desulfosarcina alkanivorans TaxID=571177 RepID=A0A5K7YLH2_9BACT|nr:TlpA disulfide reductase family protein [Desulfosarcina alkanivorans]BBO69265.1 alkyl hydroperoxide reductase [Desulfosarcina alkanivorans]